MRREQIEIQVAILQTLEGKDRVATQIIGLANLNYKTCKPLLEKLMQRKIIIKIENKYHLTGEGKRILGELRTVLSWVHGGER